MSPPKPGSFQPADPRLFDLMIQRATTGLAPDEQQELDRLPDAFQAEPEQIELVFAALELARMPSAAVAMEDELPAGLRSRLVSDAERFFKASQHSLERSVEQAVANGAPVRPVVNAASRHSSGGQRRSSLSPVTRREVLAMLITAASLLLVFSGRNPLAFNASGNGQPPVAAVLQTPAERLEALVASAPDDLIQLPWKPVMDPDAGGKVIWSDQRQEGYMVFTGMEFNDPSVEQYQLWIFDNDPGQAAPPSGGVFDLSGAMADATGRIVVPIKPSVPIGNAVQFAITVETPGGVYQSKREKLPVLASLN